jgi:cytoskeletal protein RodZ
MNEEVKLVPSAVPEALDSSVGRMLAQARENLNIEVDKMADRLNLGVDVIRAIESGQKEGIPRGPFWKGYIRSYAKLVNLDLDTALPSWEEEYPPVTFEKVLPIESEARMRRMPRRKRKMVKRRSSKKKWGLIMASVLLVVVIGFGLLSIFDKSNLPLSHLISRQPVVTIQSSQQAGKSESTLMIPLEPPSQLQGS